MAPAVDKASFRVALFQYCVTYPVMTTGSAGTLKGKHKHMMGAIIVKTDESNH